MKNTISLLAILVLTSAIVSAQKPEAAWIRTINNDGQSIISVIDFWVDPAGNSYYLGYCYGDISLEQGPQIPTNSFEQVFLAKYLPDGSFGWVHAFGIYDFSDGQISGDAEGNLYLCGASHGYVPFGNDVEHYQSCSNCSEIFIAKYNPDGVAQWAKTIEAEDNTDFKRCGLGLDAAGNLYLSGYYSGEKMTFPDGSTYQLPYASGFFLARLDQDANPVWVQTLQDGSGAENLILAISADGTCFLTGFYGKLLRFTHFNELPYYNDFSNLYIAAYSSAGDFLWAKNLHSSSFIGVNDLKADEQGGVYFASYAFEPLLSGTDTIVPAGPGDHAGFLLSVDQSSVSVPVLTRHGYWANSISTLSVAPDGKFYTGGYYYDTLFNTVNNVNISNNGDGDILLCSGKGAQLESVVNLGGSGYEDISNSLGGTGMGMDAKGNLFVSGNFSPTVNIDPLSATGQGVYIAKLRTGTVSTTETLQTNLIKASPNPASGPFEVQLQTDSPEGALVLFDLNGRERYRAQVVKKVQTIDAGLPAGVYYLQWQVGGRVNGFQKVSIMR